MNQAETSSYLHKLRQLVNGLSRLAARDRSQRARSTLTLHALAPSFLAKNTSSHPSKPSSSSSKPSSGSMGKTPSSKSGRRTAAAPAVATSSLQLSEASARFFSGRTEEEKRTMMREKVSKGSQYNSLLPASSTGS